MNLAYGFFSGGIAGDPVLRWLSDGRNMQLVSDYFYTDLVGKVWPNYTGNIIDGASIPKTLWTLYGGPFEGIYRNASVLHDYVCDHYKTIEERKAGDQMFRVACLCAGCDPEQAITLYLGVSAGTLKAEMEGKTHGPKAFNVDVPDRPGNWH